MGAVELNNRLMLLERESEEEEYRIFAQLTAMVRGYVPELHMTFDAMVALDALNACAIFAERFGCVEPEIVEAGIELLGARPPPLVTNGQQGGPIEVPIRPPPQGLVSSVPNTD